MKIKNNKYMHFEAAIAAVLVLNGCSEKTQVDAKKEVAPAAYAQEVAVPPQSGEKPMLQPLLKVEHAADVGINFIHETGAAGKKLMPEALGAGCALFDYDGDGRLDALFADGRPWTEQNLKATAKHKSAKGAAAKQVVRPMLRLYKNEGERFKEITETAGLGSVSGYGMGFAIADYDADGDSDIVVTTLEGNRLLRNDAGIYTDVTKAAGLELAVPEWATSAAWLDADNDGRLDLFVAHYVKWTPQTDVFSTLDGSNKSYSPPKLYNGFNNRLYHNLGNGRFVDVSEAAGLRSGINKALGVVVLDANDDHFPDIFVANDTVANELYINDGKGKFTDTAMLSGVGYDELGEARAGMGVDSTESVNGSQAIVIGNFSDEPVSLYERVTSGKVFVDAAQKRGIAEATMPRLTFGSRFADLDNDGRDDLILVNGHIEPDVEKVQSSVVYRQPIDIFLAQENGRFVSQSELTGQPVSEPILGRCLAVGDIDNDGDLDGLVSVNGGAPLILRNVTGGERAVMIDLRTSGTGNIEALGAEVELSSADWSRREIVRARGSYLGHSPYTLHFGVPHSAGDSVKVKVRWPDGSVDERGTVQVGERYRILQNGELTSTTLRSK